MDLGRVDERQCPACGATWSRTAGVWRCLSGTDTARFERFLEDYQCVRRDEGRGSPDPEFYRTLPFHAFAAHDEHWRIRAVSYEAFMAQVVEPAHARQGRCQRVVDLGAGNAWLSNRLAARGHLVAAVDLSVDADDGLRCRERYETRFVAVQATFDRLPFQGGQFDLAVFNGSLHYSTSYDRSLAEALRVLSPSGSLVIFDSPLYRDASSGAQMVSERAHAFAAKFGRPPHPLPSEHFLTWNRLTELGQALGVDWHFVRPGYGWRWRLRPYLARLLGRREPATFLIVVGRRSGLEATP
jgi:SAM-dependent methyltransferase